MEELFVKIGELLAMELDEVREITYLDKDMGYMMLLSLNGGEKVILSLIESKL